MVRWGWELAKTCPPGWPPSHPLLPRPVSEAIVLGTLSNDPGLKTMPGGEGCLMLSGFQLGSDVSGCGPDTLTQSLLTTPLIMQAQLPPGFSLALTCVSRLARVGRGRTTLEVEFFASQLLQVLPTSFCPLAWCCKGNVPCRRFPPCGVPDLD